jgi:H+/gluconate symporter-like permease
MKMKDAVGGPMFAIILSLVLLMYLAYRGVSVLILAPTLSLMAAGLSGGAPILATYTQVFMEALGGYVIRFFPLFLLGAIFGKLMEVSGSAKVIAEWIIEKVGQGQAALAVVLACAVLTYGGVSLFVVAFAVYPIAASLFARAGSPKRFIPAAIALGSFTFTMTALPGTPAIQNAIPAPYFGTDAFAAPVLGLLAGAIMFAGGVLWLNWRIGRAMRAGDGYGEEDEYAAEAGAPPSARSETGPVFALAILPIIVVILLNLILSRFVFPAMDFSYLAEEVYGGITIDDVRGIWAIIAALCAAILTIIAVNFATLRDGLNDALTKGVNGSFLPIFNTASEVGYGTVIASLPAFVIIKNGVTGIMPDTPLVSLAIAVNVLAGITGSASGGMSIALEALGDTYVQLAQAVDLNPELLHRVAAISSGGFDCLPHNGAVITLLAITGLTHRKSYPDLFVVAVLVPVCALITVIVLGSLFGSI